MKKTILTLLVAILSVAANAQINYTDLNPDSTYTISPSGTYSADSAIWLDIDNDNTDDFYFKYEYIIGFGGTTWKVQMQCINSANQGYWKSTSTSNGHHYLKGLSKGDSITANVLFGNDTEPLLGDDVDQNIVSNGDKYIGIKFKSGTNTYYGWILVNINLGATSGTMTVKEYAYNTTPGQGLNAGDTCLKTTYTTVASACDSVVWNGATYRSPGTYFDTLTNSQGCDSIDKLIFTRDTSLNYMAVSACDSFSLNGVTYTTSGLKFQNYTNSKGCDSTIILDLTINTSGADTTINVTACESYTINGVTYDSSGTYQINDTTMGNSGCGSDTFMVLTINHATSATLNGTACDSARLFGVTYTQTGTYTDTITNLAGCDSIITLNLTINKSTSSNLTETACDSFTLNGTTYYSSGIYTQTITNSAGCDSTINLALLIRKSSGFTITATACNDYTLNGTTYTSSGNYTQTLTNWLGCDSVITLNLTINTIDTSVTQNNDTLTANLSGVNYQWIDCSTNMPISGETGQSFTATANGSYAVIVSNSTCVDTSNCYSVTQVGIERTTFPTSIVAYPNPTDGAISIDLGNSYSDVSITVYNSIGKQVKTLTIKQAQEINFEIEGESGVYFVEVNGEGYSARIKILKQ